MEKDLSLLFNQNKVALTPKNIFNQKKPFSIKEKKVFECKKIFETQKSAFEHFFSLSYYLIENHFF